MLSVPIDGLLNVHLRLQQALCAVAVPIFAQLVHRQRGSAGLRRVTPGFVDLRDELVFDGVEMTHIAVSASQETELVCCWSLLVVCCSEHEVPASQSVVRQQWIVQFQVSIACQRLALAVECLMAKAVVPCLVRSTIWRLVQRIEALGVALLWPAGSRPEAELGQLFLFHLRRRLRCWQVGHCRRQLGRRELKLFLWLHLIELLH